jgi:hypothetical protein
MAGEFGPRSILVLSGVSCVLAAAVAGLAARGRVEAPGSAADGTEQAA